MSQENIEGFKPQNPVTVLAHQRTELTKIETVIIKSPLGIFLLTIGYGAPNDPEKVTDVGAELHPENGVTVDYDALGDLKLHSSGLGMFISPKQAARLLFTCRKVARVTRDKETAMMMDDLGKRVRRFYDEGRRMHQERETQREEHPGQPRFQVPSGVRGSPLTF